MSAAEKDFQDREHDDRKHADHKHEELKHDGGTRQLAPNTEAESDYDPSKYPSVALSVDLVVFAMTNTTLNVAVIERGESPFKGALALPGGFVQPHEDALTAAYRELAEETGLQLNNFRVHVEQLASYTEPNRDPRMRVVSVAHLVLLGQGQGQARVQSQAQGQGQGQGQAQARAQSLAQGQAQAQAGEQTRGEQTRGEQTQGEQKHEEGRPRAASAAEIPELSAGTDASAARWEPVHELNLEDLAFDHAEILSAGLERLAGKMEYTTVAASLVGEEFTISELRDVYTATWQSELPAGNFTRKMRSSLTPTGAKVRGVGAPASLFTVGSQWITPPWSRPEA